MRFNLHCFPSKHAQFANVSIIRWVALSKSHFYKRTFNNGVTFQYAVRSHGADTFDGYGRKWCRMKTDNMKKKRTSGTGLALWKHLSGVIFIRAIFPFRIVHENPIRRHLVRSGATDASFDGNYWSWNGRVCVCLPFQWFASRCLTNS